MEYSETAVVPCDELFTFTRYVVVFEWCILPSCIRQRSRKICQHLQQNSPSITPCKRKAKCQSALGIPSIPNTFPVPTLLPLLPSPVRKKFRHIGRANPQRCGQACEFHQRDQVVTWWRLTSSVLRFEVGPPFKQRPCSKHRSGT